MILLDNFKPYYNSQKYNKISVNMKISKYQFLWYERKTFNNLINYVIFPENKIILKSKHE